MKHLFFHSMFIALFCLGTASVSISAQENIFPEVNPIAQLLTQGPAIGPHPQDDAYLYRIHNDAYYHLATISDNGDLVQLHDASKWSVHPNHRKTVMYWVGNDDIFIKPYASCFSSYRYVLYNRTLRQIAEVNLVNPPLPMGEATFRIVNIEPYARLVQLSDNTIWQIDSRDGSFPHWQVGQRLLVGVNNRWRTAALPHILINVDMYKEPFIQADFYGYPVGY